MYAGPEAERPVTASMCFSSTITARPTVSKMRCGQLHLRGRDKAPAAQAGCARAQRGRRVGHGADHADLHARGLFNRARLHRCGKRDERLLRRQRGRISAIRSGTWNGLTPSRIRSACCAAARLSVLTSTPHCVLSATAPLGVGHGGVNLVRRKQVLLQKRLQQNAAHLARAQHGDAHVGQLRGYFSGPQRRSPS